MIAVVILSMVLTFIACISIFLAPCIVTYWRYGRWLGAVNCPVCRQQVSEQNIIALVFHVLKLSPVPVNMFQENFSSLRQLGRITSNNKSLKATTYECEP